MFSCLSFTLETKRNDMKHKLKVSNEIILNENSNKTEENKAVGVKNLKEFGYFQEFNVLFLINFEIFYDRPLLIETKNCFSHFTIFTEMELVVLFYFAISNQISFVSNITQDDHQIRFWFAKFLSFFVLVLSTTWKWRFKTNNRAHLYQTLF